MANNSKERSRFPKAADRGDSEVSALDEKFLPLWTKRLEPKKPDANKDIQKEMQDNLQKKSEAIEGEIKKIVGACVKTEVDRLEKNGH